jgi:hypothetical protein
MTPAEFRVALDIDSNNVAPRVKMHIHTVLLTSIYDPAL